MTIPLLALMLGSAVAGFINVPSGVLGLDSVFGAHRFTDWLSATLVHAHAAEFQWWIAIATTILALGAILASRSIYGRPNPLLGEERTDPLAAGSLGPAWSLANAKLYWDEFYYRVFERPFNVLGVFLAELVDRRFWAEYFHNTVIRDGFNAMGEVLSKPFDLGIIDGIVNGIGRVTRWASGVVRHTQTGYVRTYALTLLLGVVIVIIVLLLPLLQSNG
jgi:NADH-quinone oxidoreductase subunit L